MSVGSGLPIPTFADEFDTLQLKQSGDAGGWSTAFDWDRYAAHSAHTIWGESQVYVDPTFVGSDGAALGINPFSTAGGVLTISAAQTSPEAKAALWGHDFSSGLITTSGTFAQTYGYFEMRADLPSGQGAFPAFWLLPQDGSYDGEIDVMETVNGGNQMWNHIHYRTSEVSDWSHQGFGVTVPSLTEGFHTFGALWTPETITWFVDGSAVNSTLTPAMLNKPMYMLANYAVGGSWAGPQDGSPLSDMKIDYIRAYSLDSAPVVAPAGLVRSIDGAAADDPLWGSSAADSMRGYDGNDTLEGGDGNDNLNGNQGDDLVVAGAGFDTLYGGQGDDTVMGVAGQKLLLGNMGRDIIHAGTGESTLYGGQDNDLLYGAQAADHLHGDRGDDLLFGGGGGDRFYLEAGGGTDWVGDFNSAQGDRVVIAAGASYTVDALDGQALIRLADGSAIGLAGVSPAAMGDWLVPG